jgi:hypothetical protein
VRKSLALGPFQHSAQVWGLLCQHEDDLIEVAVGGSPGNAVVAGQRVSSGAIAESSQPRHRRPET